MKKYGNHDKSNFLVKELTLREVLNAIGLSDVKARSFVKASIETKKRILQEPSILTRIGNTLMSILKKENNLSEIKRMLNLIYNNRKLCQSPNVIKLLRRLMLFLLVEPEIFANKKKFILTPYGYYILTALNQGRNIFKTIQNIYIPPGKTIIHGKDLFKRREIVSYHNFMYNYLSNYSYSDSTILILPCSLKKPYSISFMRKKIYAMLKKTNKLNKQKIEIITMSEPLVLVPRYFETYYPAANYDLPPKKLTETDIEIYKYHLKKMLNIIINQVPRKIVYTLPRFHKRIFEEVLDDKLSQSINAIQYIPYNIYYLPKLKESLKIV